MSVNTYSLVSLEEVKEQIKSTIPEEDDFISNLINRYSTLIESYLNKNVLSREYTEYFDGGGYSELFVNQYPITSVSGIYDDSNWEWNVGDLIDADDYRVTNDANSIVFNTTTLGDYKENIKIVYTAGYDETPEDIKMVCIKEVARAYTDRKELGITSKSRSDGSVAYLAQSLLEETEMVLDKYKLIGVC